MVLRVSGVCTPRSGLSNLEKTNRRIPRLVTRLNYRDTMIFSVYLLTYRILKENMVINLILISSVMINMEFYQN